MVRATEEAPDDITHFVRGKRSGEKKNPPGSFPNRG